MIRNLFFSCAITFLTIFDSHFLPFCNDCVSFSSMVDPEECYSIGKAFGDVGVFPSRNFNGNGIKIGLIDDGIPANLYEFSDYYTLGSTIGNHPSNVSSIFCGPNSLASDATFYFASRNQHDGFSFEDCLRWLVEENDVDVICHTMSYGGDEGYYFHSVSDFMDEYIKENNVIFVNSLGNSDTAARIPSISLAINVISVGANEKDLLFSDINVTDYADDISFLVDNPTVIAPGRDLYGLTRQNLSELDLNSNYFSGTSFSAPIVTGIIALLLEEFPLLKNHPETVQSILVSSSVNGVVNYQNARYSASHYFNYNIYDATNSGDVITFANVELPSNSYIKINNFVQFNGLYNHFRDDATYVPLSEIQFSKISLNLETPDGVIESIIGSKSNTNLYYENNTSHSMNLIIKIKLSGLKAPVGIEKASLSYFCDELYNSPSLNINNLYLDTLPVLNWSFSGTNVLNGTVSIYFYNFKNQIILTKTNLGRNGFVSLSLEEWHSLLSLRGREFYCYLTGEDNAGNCYFSKLYVINEPVGYNFLYNINPSDFNFPQAYNNTPCSSTLEVNNIQININRLRCGYIEEQYINLSSKKMGAGHAYLEICFNKVIKYCSFGVTLWRDTELASYYGDEAIIEVMNQNGEWIEYIDLLNDISLPNSRKDITRFDVSNIRGLRFETFSNAVGDRNKGRLCIDNISFTDNSQFNQYVCLFTEPIVVRTSFRT